MAQKKEYLARQDAPGDKRLVAHLLTREAVPPSASELRSYLLQKLPDYMVPALYVHMQSLPHSANGKVDRRALPVPTGGLPESGSSNERARTQEEAGLARIWSRLLRIPNIGRDSNFPELGGDSILAIQVNGQARQAGSNVSLRQLFRHPTIAELAHVATTHRGVDVDQGPVTGPVELTPIQRWFFELRLEDPHRFNQAILLETTERLQLAALQRAVRQLVAHHDALRLRFHREGSVVKQVNTAADDAVTAQVIDLSTVPAAEQRDAIESVTATVQASLHLDSGPLMRVVWLDLGPLRNGRLLIVIHHLAVDGVSWRILVEDLETAYGQACRNEPPQLPRSVAVRSSIRSKNGAAVSVCTVSDWIVQVESHSFGTTTARGGPQATIRNSGPSSAMGTLQRRMGGLLPRSIRRTLLGRRCSS